jgi:hypothetical protein
MILSFYHEPSILLQYFPINHISKSLDFEYLNRNYSHNLYKEGLRVMFLYTKIFFLFTAGIVLFLDFGCTRFRTPLIDKVEIVSVQKIWDQAPYNSFTDLAFFNGKWFCAFREGKTHFGKGDCGQIRIITSTNGKNWDSATLISEEGADLRDAKLSITPDNRLMLLYFRRFNPTAYPEKHEQSFTRFSKDGFHWNEPVEVGSKERWLWRVTWHKGKAYGIDYGGPDGAPPFQAPRTGRFYSSDDGLLFKSLLEFEHAGESAMLFMDDDTALSLIRSKGDNTILGTARPPYLDWKWKDLKTRLGGPNLIKLPNGRLVAAGRLYGEPVRTSLLWLDPQKGILKEFLTFPSGGDTSYPGLVYKDGLLWVSYYSSHEGKSSIYLAKVKFP